MQFNFTFRQTPRTSGAALSRCARCYTEFATYIGNDMIQLGVPSVVEEFGVGNEWVPTSMTAYLAGGMFYSGCWPAFGPYRPPSGHADRVVVYRDLPGDAAGATIEQFTLLRFCRYQPVLYWRGWLCGDTGVF